MKRCKQCDRKEGETSFNMGASVKVTFKDGSHKKARMCDECFMEAMKRINEISNQ